MFSLDKARNKLERWFRHEQDESVHSPTAQIASKDVPRKEEECARDRSVQQFMEELRANSQEWLGRVRMIRFNSIRERVGPRWAKLQQRIELFAEKIIQEEMAPQDRYVNAGDAEFLVFFADATAEESRIRCLAIVEAINEKFLGVEESSEGPSQEVAECHVVHKDDLILEWELAASDPSDGSRGEAMSALRHGFRHDPEVLDSADIAASTQTVIDSIIARAAESRNPSELTSLLMRLLNLSRSLKVLEPALATSVKDGTNQRRLGLRVTDLPASENIVRKEHGAVAPLGTAWYDIAEVIAVLDADSDCPHTERLESLRRLQRARLERVALAKADGGLARRSHDKRPGPGQFAYTPIYRSVYQGERILQGLYRISCSGLETAPAAEDSDAFTRHRWQATLERLILEHAIQYLLDARTNKGFVLLAPVSVDTLRSPSTQRQYSVVLRSAQLHAKRRLLIEVVGYSQADNTIGMRRVIDELRLHSRAIFITLAPKSAADVERVLTEIKDLGAHAIGVNASQLSQYGNVLGTLSRLASAGAEHSMLTYVDGIGSATLLAKTIAAGINYVCAPSLRPALQAPGDTERATFDDLYSVI